VQSNGASPAFQVPRVRHRDLRHRTEAIGTLCPGSTITRVQTPYAEVDYKTSGGRDSYNALQIAVTRRRGTG
jgi:hypothetical protein